MGRGAAWVFGAGLAVVLLPTPARAQVHVDVGVLTPPVAARVVVGGPRVYVVEHHHEHVYVPYRHKKGRHRGWERARREYYRDLREARREYERDRREAECEYWHDVREAEREYRRDARRHRRW